MIITCIGDSLTYGYGVGRHHTWCALASQLTGYSFVNRGINGAMSDEIAAQPYSDGDELFVMGGLNDLFHGRRIQVPLENMLGLCRAAMRQRVVPTAGIHMQISPDVDEAWCDGPVDVAKVRAAYAEYAEKLLVQCAREGVRTVDFRPVIGPGHFLFDGIHLNRAGHECMAKTVAAAWQGVR